LFIGNFISTYDNIFIVFTLQENVLLTTNLNDQKLLVIIMNKKL